MIRNVYINGKIKTLLVVDSGGSFDFQNPVLEALKEQAERIETLEKQNDSLIQKEELLLNLLEVTAHTGTLMAKNLESLHQLENQLDQNNTIEPEENVDSKDEKK